MAKKAPSSNTDLYLGRDDGSEGPLSPVSYVPRFCVDCTHHRTIPPYHYCKASPPNLVTGAKEELSCHAMRDDRLGGACGPEGKLFEPAGPAVRVIKYEG